MDSFKEYIKSLNIEDIPWHRMITAYGTAENYPELFGILNEMRDLDAVKQAWDDISNFEHQCTMFPPAPFAVVFLVRIFKKAVNISNNPIAEWLAHKLAAEFRYYAEICSDAEKTEHAEKLPNLADALNDKYLLPEEFDEEYIEILFENEDAIPPELFYSLYYYTKAALAEVTEIHDTSF